MMTVYLALVAAHGVVSGWLTGCRCPVARAKSDPVLTEAAYLEALARMERQSLRAARKAEGRCDG
jgi:hypothetical protein